MALFKSLSKSKKSNSNPNEEKKTALNKVEKSLKKSMPKLQTDKTTVKEKKISVDENKKVKESSSVKSKKSVSTEEILASELNLKNKRGRKKNSEILEKSPVKESKPKETINADKKDLKIALLKKLKGKKEKTKPIKNSVEDIDDDFPATPEDLEDAIADVFSGITTTGEETDESFPLNLDEPILKRRPGRPPKNKDAVSSVESIKFPSTRVRIPRKVDTKPKKPLSDTLPGTNLASFFSSEVLMNGSNLSLVDLGTKEIVNIVPETNESEEEEVRPSWQPRNWVTSEGERLVIKGNELVKEERFGSLDIESTYGVIAPDQVDEVIRKIREAYKKKTIPKKPN